MECWGEGPKLTGVCYAEAIALVIALFMSFLMPGFLRYGHGCPQEPGGSLQATW